jgi:Co/Zn/Cd efflux system component
MSKSNQILLNTLDSYHSMNMKAVYLHVLNDALGSLLVIISALLNIFRVQLDISESVIAFIDPILCILFVILILKSTLPLCK